MEINTIDKNVCFFRFEDLRVYHKAVEYAEKLGQIFLTTSAPKDMLVNPFFQSAMQIAFNVAEGSQRNKSQFVHYLKIAKSNVRECVTYTNLAEKFGYFSAEQAANSMQYLIELTKMIGALITSLKNAVDYKSNNNNPNTVDDDDTLFDLN